MPLSGRKYENHDDLLDSMTDTFLRWASEFDLVAMQVDEEGEVFFTKPPCEHEDSVDEDDEIMIAFPAPARKPVSRRLAKVALPVAASMVLTGTAYAATHDTPAAQIYQAATGETIHIRDGVATVERRAPIVAAARKLAAPAVPSVVPSAEVPAEDVADLLPVHSIMALAKRTALFPESATVFAASRHGKKTLNKAKDVLPAVTEVLEKPKVVLDNVKKTVPAVTNALPLPAATAVPTPPAPTATPPVPTPTATDVVVPIVDSVLTSP